METVPGPEHGPLGVAVPIAVRVVGEIASASAVLGAFSQALPAIAALVAIAWYVVMLIESRTARRLYAWWRNRHDRPPGV